MSGLASSPHASAAQPHEAGDGTMDHGQHEAEGAVEIAQTARPFCSPRFTYIPIRRETVKLVNPRLQASMVLQTCAC